MFSRQRAKGPSAGGDKDKERRAKPGQGLPPQAASTVQDLESAFPLFKRLSTSRSIIPMLVLISLVCGIVIASLLLRQDSAGWEAPLSASVPATTTAVLPPPLTARKHTELPREPLNEQKDEITAAPPHEDDPHQKASGKHDPVAVPTEVADVPSDEGPQHTEATQLTPQPEESAATTAPPSSEPSTSTAAPVTVAPPPPLTAELTRAPESAASDVVLPLRGIQRFAYNTSDGDAREAHAFPLAKGLYLLALVKFPLEKRSAGDDGVRYTATNSFVRSRYACLCSDTIVAPSLYRLVSRALERSVRGEDAREVTTSMPEGVSPRPATINTAVEGTGPSSSAADLPDAGNFLHEGRYPVRLHDGKLLETRVMPCTGAFYSSAAIALCDPSNEPSAPDDTDPPTPAPSTRAPTAASRRSIRVTPKPAMVAIGPCSALDTEMGLELLSKRLFAPANSEVRAAFLESVAATKSAAPERTPSNNTYEQVYDMDDASDAAEMGFMCDHCGSTVVHGDGVPQGVLSRRGHVFEDITRFRRVFFNKDRHDTLIETLRGVAKTKWKVVTDVLASQHTSAVAANEDHPTMAQHSDASHRPNATRQRDNATAAAVVSGLRSMDAFAGRCDKKHKAEHFAQCFHTAASSVPRKTGNWSMVAQDRRHGNQRLVLRNSSFFGSLTQSFPMPSRLMMHPINIGGHIVCYAAGDMVCEIVGRTGGWENELIQIVAYAASELRKLTRQAASILAARLDDAQSQAEVNSSQVNATHRRDAERQAARRHSAPRGEFGHGPFDDQDDCSPLQYRQDDVTFIDVGGNVGVFAASMWKRGYRTEVFEALPQNVFLLEATRCTNQAEEFAAWEEGRSTRLLRGIRIVQQNLTLALKHEARANNETIVETDIIAAVRKQSDVVRAAAIAMLPPYYQDGPGRSSAAAGPWMPRFEVHHAALGNGKRGRGGDETLPFSLNISQATSPEDDAIAVELQAAALNAIRGEDSSESAQCVMISEQHNFGDIVILCNETLVEQAKAAIRDVGPRRARVLTEYIPRGFVHLTSLDRVLQDPAETIVLDNLAMQRRFESLMNVKTPAPATTNYTTATAMPQVNRRKIIRPSHSPRPFAQRAASGSPTPIASHSLQPANAMPLADQGSNETLIEGSNEGSFPAEEDDEVVDGQSSSEEAASGSPTPIASRPPRSLRPSAASPISHENTTAELLDFVRFTQVVMKIDVEGQEEYVMQGADEFLSNVLVRPKLILSEVWRKTNIARYGAFMIGIKGYYGFALADKVWLRSVRDVLRFHRTMTREMDTIIWVLPGYQFLLPPSAFERRSSF